MKQCITCLSEDLINIVENDLIFYYCNTCRSKNHICIDTDKKLKIKVIDQVKSHVNVAGLIKKDDRYLFLIKKDYPYGASLPSGHVQSNESIDSAIKRVIKEETGLDLKTKKNLIVKTFKDYCKYGIDSHEWNVFQCETKGTEASNTKSASIVWTKQEDIIKLPLTPPTRHLLLAMNILVDRRSQSKESNSQDMLILQKPVMQSVIDSIPTPMVIYNIETETIHPNKFCSDLLNVLKKESQANFNLFNDFLKSTIQRGLNSNKNISANIKIGDHGLNLSANIFTENNAVAGLTVIIKNISKTEEELISHRIINQSLLSLVTSKNQSLIISRIIKDTIVNLNLTSASLMLNDNQGLTTNFWFDQYGKPKRQKPITLKPGQGIAGIVAKTGIPMATHDVTTNESFHGKELPENQQSIFSTPVIIHKNILGVLNVTKQKGQLFSEIETKMIQSVAIQIGVAITTGKLYKDLNNEKKSLKQILAETTNGIVALDKELNISFINDAAKKMMNTPVSCQSLKCLLKNSSDENEQKMIKFIDRCMINKSKTTAEFSTSKKPTRYLKITFTPILNNDKFVTGVLIVINDITSLKQKQETIYKENKRISRIINNTADGIIVFDSKKRVILYNKAIRKIANIINRKDGFSESFNKTFSIPTKSFQNDEKLYKEFCIKDSDGDNYWLGVTYSIVRSSHAAVNIIAVVRDIMKEKSFELRQKEFIYTITHELRTPITAIKGYLSMILNGDAGSLNTQQSHYIERTSKATDRLVLLVEDILQASRVENDKINYTVEPFNINEICQEVVLDFRQKARHKKIEIEFNSKLNNDLWANGDKEKTSRALANLVDNAIKYSLVGPIRITVDKNDTSVIVRVKDKGIGLSNKDQQLVFEKFYRANTNLGVKEGGSGLGLYIVKNIIEKQSGKINIKSELGKGSEFSLSLPISNH